MKQCLEPLRKSDEFVLYRAKDPTFPSQSFLLLVPASAQPAQGTLKKLEHEYSLRNELESAWAVRPIGLSEHSGQKALVLEDPGGETLDRMVRQPMEIAQFLHLAVDLAKALCGLHQKDLIHKNVNPANIIVDPAAGRVRLMGFGITSRIPRERQAPGPPEFIAGTLPYMAPEQTGRMNRSIDSRCDLYALGVTLYEALTGVLPFTASDPIEWVHCHIARQPVPPSERLNGIPDPVSAIIMKLLAKTPEERYQTAAGAGSDLRHCLSEWETQHHIDEFVLGEQDMPDRLLIPEKLYGREPEIATLLAAFDRVVAGGKPELLLVAGFSGIGKSAVVNELHKPLVPPRGLFASGKFDQYKRDVPYATLVQAFQSLLRALLTKSEAELSTWRDALRQALDPNGQLIVNLVPELRLIIGDQPAIPELPPQDARRRFHLVFRRFISVFAQSEHPLALFLDDLQWLDAATLDLLEDLLTHPDVRHLLLIGAYRDNEVDPTHPLMSKLQEIRQTGAIVHEIVLAPLAREDLEQLIVDSLRCEPDRAAPLAQLVQGKTGGNPFFAIRFLVSLADEGLLRFDHGEGRWSWDLNCIGEKGFTDNVVDLMVQKLRRLRQETQSALKQLSCLGHSADITMLVQLFGTSEEQVHADLWEALRLELVDCAAHSYRFVHDRIQEAAYSLIPEESRMEAHLRIGRLLATQMPPHQRTESIFDIVNQLNRGTSLISLSEEREQLAELNLIAGQRAKASSAYGSALTYLVAGAALLANDCWERRHDLAFTLELNRAECQCVTGQLVAAEKRLAALTTHAATPVERAAVASLRVDLYLMLDQSDRAITVGLEYLRHFGIEWSAHPTDDEVRREYELVLSQLGIRAIEDLIALAVMSDPASLVTLDVLTRLATPAGTLDRNLQALLSCRAANLSLERGNSDASCCAYVSVGIIAGARFGDYQTGYRFGRLGCELAEQRGRTRLQPRAYSLFGAFVVPWTRPFKSSRDLLRRAFEIAKSIGDVVYALASSISVNNNMLISGDHLTEVENECERGIKFAEKAGFGQAVDAIAAHLGLVRTLRGSTRRFGSFDGEQFDEQQAERRFASNPNLQVAASLYWVRKLQARFLAGDAAAAFYAAQQAERLMQISDPTLEFAEYHFYSALSRAASCDGVPPDERQQHLEALFLHQRRLEIWAHNCPENFEDRAALVGAEVARIEGRLLDAEQLYEKAIRSAHANGFVHNEAVANELAARFYATRGLERIAHAYRHDARYCYQRWGADAKVRQLEELFPQLSEGDQAARGANTIDTAVERLDLRTVITVSQAVSAVMDLDKLVDVVMRAAIEHAGAGRGLLILSRPDGQQIEAEAKTIGNEILVQRKEAAPCTLPQSIINYVVRAQDFVILDDASIQNRFAEDTYFSEHNSRSVLCLPLITQGNLVGVLYLENDLAPRVFTPSRIAILKVLASQAAISLESARLYSDLSDREAKIRRLVEANIIGICMANVEGDIIESNDAFLQIVGYDRELFESTPMRWTEMTPPEWRENDAKLLTELHVNGTVPPFEKEFFRKDGSRVPILVGAALFEPGGTEGVCFVLDLSEQKRAEAEIQRQNERLGLLLNLTSKITSSLDPREVLRSIAANIREVIHADAVVVSLPDEASGKFKAFAVDFPLGKGVLREELLITPSTACKKAMDTLKPVVWDWRERDELAPEISDVAAAEGVRVSCDIPLVNRGRALGNLGILRRTETPFTPEDVDFLGRASGQIAIALANALAYREISELKDRLVQEKLYLEQEIRGDMHFEQIVGNSPALKRVLQLVETVAPTDSTVLLLGETGTGKELIARAIHEGSRRKERTFVKLNCAAIPTGLLESELFGHERGAFTGAIAQKIGRLELANEGTLFLDEVGDIPVEVQPKLLRALQEREFERLGSTQTRKVNVRLVAATNRDLEKMIREREFRSDLYYRLNVFPIRIPPLRERKEDIPLLVSYFVQRFAKQMQRKIETIPTAVMKRLTAWEWPGNIRELENLMERAVILTRGRSLEAPLAELQNAKVEDLPHADEHDVRQVARQRTNSASDKTTIADEYARKQRDAIVRALTESKGRVGGLHGAATRLGTNRTTLLARMKKLGIDRREYV